MKEKNDAFDPYLAARNVIEEQERKDAHQAALEKKWDDEAEEHRLEGIRLDQERVAENTRRSDIIAANKVICDAANKKLVERFNEM